MSNAAGRVKDADQRLQRHQGVTMTMHATSELVHLLQGQRDEPGYAQFTHQTQQPQGLSNSIPIIGPDDEARVPYR